MGDTKPAAEKMVRIQYNKPVPHKIAAHRGGDDTDPTPAITLREGLNHVGAAAWEAAKKLTVVQHHLTAKVVPAVRDGKHVLVPLIEELGDAPTADEAAAKKKAEAKAKGKAEAEAAERERAAAEQKAREEAEAKEKAEAEAAAKRAQQGGGGGGGGQRSGGSGR